MSNRKNRSFKARDKKRKIAKNKEKRKIYNINRQHKRRQYKHTEKVQRAAKYVDIFTKEKLCNAEILVLAKGLKFIPSPNLRNAKKTLINDFNELARKMRCKYHFDNGSHQYNRHPFLSKSGYKPNWANNAIENYLFSTRIELEKIQTKSFKDNLPKNERKALQSLRSNDHIIIKKADKNSSTVVLDKELYIKMANDQLNDNVHYERINESHTTEVLDISYCDVSSIVWNTQYGRKYVLNQNDVKHNMESKFTWIVLFLLDFIPCKVTAGHGMTISPGRMTWLESFSYCRLASEDSKQYLNDGEYKGWGGGIYLNSQWMIHKGCYSNSGAANSNAVYDIKRLTPALCSAKCKMIPYFALKEADSSKCTYKCSGSNNDVCGERSHYTVFQHIIAKLQPKSDVDQHLTCSVIVPRNDTFVLKAVDCFLKYWTICVIFGVPKQMGFTETYQSAYNRCSSINGTILSTIHNLDKLEDGRGYWSNIFRSRFLKWTTNESFDEICNEVDGLLNVDCVHLTVKYREIKYIPLPCKYEYTAICNPKQPGDPAVIRQCQTNNDITTITSDQTEPEHSDKSSNKPDPAPTTLSTETLFLTSSLATMSTYFVSTTSEYTNPVTPSSLKDMSTNFVSTNSDDIDSFKPSISSEHSSVWSRSSTLFVSSSQTSISDTTIGTHMELTTLVAQMDNDNRTVANETTNDGLIYSIIFSLVPASVALAVLIIMAVLITVVRRRRREKTHPESNGLHVELGALQPIIEYEKKAYDNQKNYWKTQDRGNPDCQIYDEANDQYQHLDFNVRSKEPTCFEAEYGYAMTTTSFFKPDQKNPPTNSALKIAMAKRAKMIRTSLNFLQGPFTKQKSEKENVAYCDTAIVHTKFLYDTPQQSIKHVNKP
ncbi:unnamed protein product [Mytilus coruscus]|uniref:Uncharacterized protein n=1 Tax=Mytilus coruscus TaxID=42192 RepID=A0A6J8BQI6_MYTCO|nr:unnamed protein product [Mytilus coruscus]